MAKVITFRTIAPVALSIDKVAMFIATGMITPMRADTISKLGGACISR